MQNLTSLLLIVPLFSILMVQTVRGQTEDEFRQEFQQYAETHSESETRSYVLSRLSQMTNNTIWDEYQWSLLENLFTIAPCLTVKRQICDQEFYAKMAEVTAVSTAAMFACAVTITNPLGFAACAAAVAYQHALRLSSASKTHRACYLRARLECLPPSPPPCIDLFSSDPVSGADDGEPGPLLADCDYSLDCSCQPRSPIIIDVAGNGFNLTNAANGVTFDMTGITGPERLGWTQANSDDAFLALDLNANGLIENGTELFGNFTLQPASRNGHDRNGFEALTVYDANNDGQIDNEDGVYSELRLWQDGNHNGISEPEELHPLEQLGLKTLDLKYRRSQRVDRHGNEFRYRAKVKDTRDAQLGRWAWDVFLVSSRRRGLSERGLAW